MTDATEYATPPKSFKLRISNYLVQIRIEAKFEFEFVPRDTEEFEFFDLVDFGDVEFSVETVITYCETRR